MSSFLCKCQIHVLIYFLVHFVHVYNYVLHHKNEPLWPYTKRDGLENRRKSTGFRMKTEWFTSFRKKTEEKRTRFREKTEEKSTRFREKAEKKSTIFRKKNPKNEWASDCCLMQQWSIFHLYHSENAAIRWNVEDICFELDRSVGFL